VLARYWCLSGVGCWTRHGTEPIGRVSGNLSAEKKDHRETLEVEPRNWFIFAIYEDLNRDAKSHSSQIEVLPKLPG
jgi:hypothetical protein